MNKRVIAAAAAALLAVPVLAACSPVRTQTSTCAIVVGKSFQQNHGVKQVVYPNQKVGNLDNDTVWYVPCNGRNYAITPDKDHGDRHTATVITTGKGTDGSPGVQIRVWWTMHWTLNENKVTMYDFWAFCQKYTCQSSEQNDNAANNSTPGWNSMLAENMGPAIDRAGITAGLSYAPDVWKDQSKWPTFATDASKYILAELRASVQPFNDDFFCVDATTTQTGGKCAAPTFTIENMDPVNQNLIQIQNKQSEMDAQAAQNAKRLTQAQQLYGPYAHQVLAQEDIIDHCNSAGQKCTVVVGGNGNVSVPNN